MVHAQCDTDNAQVSFVLLEVCQLGGAAIIFLESWNFEKSFGGESLWKNDIYVILDPFLVQKPVKRAKKM